MCEALVIVLRFVDEKWNLQQRVVQLMLLTKATHCLFVHRISYQF